MKIKNNPIYLLILIVISLLFALPLKAQVNIGSDTIPHSFSILELTTSILKGGLRLPQLTTDAISKLNTAGVDAAQGLVVYNMNNNCLEFWNGNTWISLCDNILPTLEVDPASMKFDSNGNITSSATNKVTVTTNQSSWKTSIAYDANGSDWLTLSQSGGSGTSFTVACTVNTSSNAVRTATITVSATGATSQTVTVTQNMDINSIPAGGTSAATNTYIGAFWRASQTGERIIRITGVAAGAWTASVGWYDSRWNVAGGDGIIFSSTGTSDTGVTFDASESPNDAELYPVTNGASTASGTIVGVNTIMFRMGCQKTFAAWNAASNPARYAVVVLSYANNTMFQKIFIRQGEAPDYLPGQSSGKKWSVYNLGNSNDRTQYGNGGFTTYPTQGGYLYQWGYGTNAATDQAPRPYPPTGDASTLTPPWTTGADVLYALGSACPDNYTVPSGFTVPSGGDGDMSYIPVQASTAWGYYADGFFDRRQVVSSPTGVAVSTVSVGDNNIAYQGKLFFNSTTNVSLFMPFPGGRTTGPLSGNGNVGVYWSSTGTIANTTAFDAEDLTINSSNVTTNPVGASRGQAFSVRCVKNN